MKQAISTVTGKGTHSVLGEVSVMSIVHVNEIGKNLVDFTETDADGSSLFVRAVGRASTTADGWGADGIITGGTGKYLGASGTYQVKLGVDNESTTTWSAEGTLYLIGDDKESEENAIKEVIVQETRAYVAADNERGNDLRTKHYSHVINMPQDHVVLTTLSNKNEPLYPDKTIQMSNLKRTNWDIQIRGDVAWVVFNQITDAFGSSVPTVETRVLEKKDGQWKIAHMQTAVDYANANPNINVPGISSDDDATLRTMFEDYIAAINGDDWERTAIPFLTRDVEEFIIDHREFRKAFEDFHADIKHLVVEGDYAMAWMSISAKHVGVYNGLYAGKESAQIQATGKAMQWEEVWYFDKTDDNKFGPTFDFMSQDLVRMKQLGIKELPE